MRTGKGVEDGGGADPADAADAPRALPHPLAAALVFVAAGAVLVLEILAVRLLAPYVGLTLETTTSIIGAALAGIAVGAALGGYFADRTNTRLLIVCLLILGGLLALLTVPLVRLLGPGVRGDGDLSALLITVVSLVPAAAVLSAVSPAVAHLQLHDLRVSGTVVGGLSAWATAGALLGTFGTGFLLVPLFPVSTSVLLVGLVLVLVGLALAMWGRLLAAPALLAIAIGAAALAALSLTPDSPCERESDYHCLSLAADPASSSGRELLLDDVHNSYVDLEDPTHLQYSYTRWIAEAIDRFRPPPQRLDVLFVGGGGFTLPRWLLATRPGSKATVLEVDPGVVEFDEDELGLRRSADLRAIVGDARMSILDLGDESSDVVVGDAFSGYGVPWHLTTVEWIDEVRRVLRPGGLYALNLIDLEPLDFVEAEIATLLDRFGYVSLVAFPGEGGRPYGGNLVVLASDRPIEPLVGATDEGAIGFEQAAIEELAADAEVLRDDHAPVDQLQTVD
jgi:spermidine synthase